MMKKKNKGKKALTAVGAVVAAGLTPGFVAASAPGSPIQGSNAGITAADVVAIDGNAYSFDELYAMQRGESVDTIEMNIVLEPATDLPEVEVTGYQRVTKYGGPLPPSSVMSIPEQMPQFHGGEAALKEYIESHIQYPAKAILNKIEGEVLVQFIVRTTGEIGTVNVINSVDKDLDEEAVRVVKSLPSFIPGRRNGKAMVMWYTLPVVFKLPEENND